MLCCNYITRKVNKNECAHQEYLGRQAHIRSGSVYDGVGINPQIKKTE